MRWFARFALSALLLTTLAAIPSAAASDGCWYSETTQQELVAVGSESIYLEIDQLVFSPTCDPGDTRSAASKCSGVEPGEGDTTQTPPVELPEVRVLGITIVEEGDGVPSQQVPVPGYPDVAFAEHTECTAQPVVRLVIDSDQDTVVGSDGTVEEGSVPFIGGADGLVDEQVRAVLAFLTPFADDCDAFDVSPAWVCMGNTYGYGILVRILNGWYAF